MGPIRTWYICYLGNPSWLDLLILGITGIFIKGDFVEGEGCVLTHISNVPLAVSALYGMTLDFVIFLIAVHNVRTGFLSWTQPGTLVRLFIKEGFIYLLSSYVTLLHLYMIFTLHPSCPVSVVANAIAAMCLVINHDPSMAIMANLPAAVAYAVSRFLLNYTKTLNSIDCIYAGCQRFTYLPSSDISVRTSSILEIFSALIQE